MRANDCPLVDRIQLGDWMSSPPAMRLAGFTARPAEPAAAPPRSPGAWPAGPSIVVAGAPGVRGWGRCRPTVAWLRQKARHDPERQDAQRDAGDADDGVLDERGSNTCDDDTCHDVLHRCRGSVLQSPTVRSCLASLGNRKPSEFPFWSQGRRGIFNSRSHRQTYGPGFPPIANGFRRSRPAMLVVLSRCACCHKHRRRFPIFDGSPSP